MKRAATQYIVYETKQKSRFSQNYRTSTSDLNPPGKPQGKTEERKPHPWGN